MGLQMFLSLVARAATLGNSCNLHKCKMAAIGLYRDVWIAAIA